MKKLLSITILSLLCSSSFAQEWLNIGDTTSSFYSINTLSFESVKTKSNLKLYGAIIKKEDKFTHQVEMSYLFINHLECTKIKGISYYYDLDKNFLYKSNWVRNSGTINSDISNFICVNLLDKLVQENSEIILNNK